MDARGLREDVAQVVLFRDGNTIAIDLTFTEAADPSAGDLEKLAETIAAARILPVDSAGSAEDQDN
jgi:hypothetical protein